MKMKNVLIGTLAAVLGGAGIFYLASNSDTVRPDSTNVNAVYFSNSGDDGNTGTKDNPFRSVLKAQSQILLGKSPLFKRGEEFYGSLTIGKSGTSASRIVIGSYGTGENSILTSMVEVKNWNPLGNGIYESEAIIAPIDLNMVTLNDTIVGMGVYPNKDNGNGGYLTLSAFEAKTSITLPMLPISPDWTGADLVIRAERWKLDRSKIKLHNTANHIIYYTGLVEPKKGFGAFITNNPKTLDKFGEWYWNPNTSKLMMYFGNQTPGKVKIASKQNGVTAVGRSYISIKDLIIQGFNHNGVDFTGGSTKDSLVSCSINNSGYTGLFVQSSTNFSVEGCNVTNSLNSGVDMYIGTDNARIRHTRIINTSMLAGMGATGDQKGIALNVRGQGSLAEYNELINCGFQGIYFGPEDDIVMQYNFINGYGIVKDDCGAFYTYTGGTKLPLKGRVIRGNVVLNGLGASYGTNQSAGLFANSSFGFYGDANASGILVIGNYFEAVGRGVMFLHFAHDVIFTHNICFNTPIMMYVVRDSTRDNYSNTITNNSFFTIGNQYHAKFDNYANTLNSTVGKIDSNFYINFSSRVTPWAIRANNYNFDQWKASTPWDDHSAQRVIGSNDVIKHVYAVDSAKNIDLQGYTWKTSRGKTFINPLQPYTGDVLIRDVPFEDNTNFPIINITSNSTTFNAPAKIDLIAIASDKDGTVKQVEFFVNGKHLRTDITSLPWSATWSDVKVGNYTFNAKATDNSGNVTISNSVSVTVK